MQPAFKRFCHIQDENRKSGAASIFDQFSKPIEKVPSPFANTVEDRKSTWYSAKNEAYFTIEPHAMKFMKREPFLMTNGLAHWSSFFFFCVLMDIKSD